MRKLLLIGALASLPALLLAPRAANAQNVSKTDSNPNVSKTAKAGAYSVTLKVLPAESFVGVNHEMARDGGAEPDAVEATPVPNHHLVAFVKSDGKPVEDAAVKIRYRETSPRETDWKSLPVVRMHVAGKSLETTHYGNNVQLEKGSYEAKVVVNGATASYTFTVS